MRGMLAEVVTWRNELLREAEEAKGRGDTERERVLRENAEIAGVMELRLGKEVKMCSGYIDWKQRKITKFPNYQSESDNAPNSWACEETDDDSGASGSGSTSK
ncbi:Uncharacterized protein Rs2_05902 [Raphanus sativus]|nr:Uncharacterized protein Rs2_05902 [Raphanus sativus]